MGREIRRVPPDWEHPKHTEGRNAGCFRSLYDNSFREAAEEWIRDFDLWREGKHPDQPSECRYFWVWNGNPPDPDSYREREWTEAEATHFQVYETVSEGTPVSPVLASREEVAAWCVGQGFSAEAAKAFSEEGYAPSMVMAGGRIYSTIEACAIPRKESWLRPGRGALPARLALRRDAGNTAGALDAGRSPVRYRQDSDSPRNAENSGERCASGPRVGCFEAVGAGANREVRD
jgi:hypothetical protein